jgi:hypothetical protein
MFRWLFVFLALPLLGQITQYPGVSGNAARLPTGPCLVKSDGSGNGSCAQAGTDYVAPANAYMTNLLLSSAGITPVIPNGSVPALYIQKPANDYGEYIVDNTGSLTPLKENLDIEMYNITGALTNVRGGIRVHIDPNNTTPTQYQLIGIGAG